MTENNAAQPGLNDTIRAVFLGHGFTIKEGQTDLKPYVYEAVHALLSKLRAEGVQAGDERALTANQRKEFIRRTSYISEADRDTRAGFVDEIARAALASAPVADERISLLGAANLAFNALHECKPAKGAEKQYSDAIQALQSALHDIAYTVNRTATPQQFADHLQREARAALASASVAGEAQPVASLGVVLGLGEYLIQTTASGEPAQVVFSQASDHDRATRTIGDIKVGGHGPFDHSRIRGQIQFTSALALDALEVQLRELRKEHWPHTLDAAPQASEAVRDAAQKSARAIAFDVWLARHCDSDDLTAYERDLARDAWNTALSAPQASSEPVDLTGIDADHLLAISASGSHTAMSNALLNVARALKTQADKDGGDCAKGAGDERAWHRLTDSERDGFVGELVDYGTDFVSPLYAVVESIERRLREKNATPSVVKQSLTATQTGEKGESDDA
jgi:GGDEF domain-containing protein